MRVRVPFDKDMVRAVLDGKKTCTTRNKRYGGMGDTFEVVAALDYATCRITNLARLTLETVAHGFFAKEGFDSPDGFRSRWAKLHPEKGFVPDQVAWLHEFEIVESHGEKVKGVLDYESEPDTSLDVGGGTYRPG